MLQACRKIVAPLGGVRAQDDLDPPSRQELRQALLAVDQGQSAEILAVELKVETVQHRFGDGPASVERAKIATPSGPHTTTSPRS
jgi:hypothetical protein